MSALSPTASPPRTDWSGHASRDCDAVRARLHDFVDDALDRDVPSARAYALVVANHVARCEHCARVEAQLRAMQLAVAEVGARMRLCEPLCLPSLNAELAMVQRVTRQAIRQRARAAAVAAEAAAATPEPEPAPTTPLLTLLSFNPPREAARPTIFPRCA